jgi:tetratricopeptide (TPR) repeat protein
VSEPPDADDIGAMLRWGRAALARQDEAAAIDLVAAAARRHPGQARLWELLGLLHRGLDALEPAVEAYDRAAALAPNDAGIAHGRARMHLEAGRPAAALFDRTQALAPGDDMVRFGRVSAIFAEQGLAAALAALERALAQHPNWAEGHKRLANLRWQAGDRDGFTASFEPALAASPRHLNLWSALLAALSQAGCHQAVRDAARRGRDAAGGHLLFDAYEAVAHDGMGEIGEAGRLYAAMQPVADATVALFYLGHLFRAGRISEAAALAETWTATAHRAQFASYLALAWRLLGDPRWQWFEGDPRLIGVYDLGEAAGPLDALAEILRSLHLARAQPLDQSVRGGTQTEGALFARPEPEIRRLRAAVAAAVERHIASLPPPDPAHPTLGVRRDRPVRFAGSWSVRLSGEGHHANHRHPGGWFSSAFYVALPKAGEMGPAPAGWLALGEPPAELGPDLAPTRLIEPRPGRLILFPSTMWHGTRPFAAGERLTVAFDVMEPVG